MCVGLAFYFRHTSTKVAYVDIQQVYDNFEMKKELEAKFNSAQQVQKGILDSMALSLRLLDNQITSGQGNDKTSTLFESKKKDFLTQQSYFENQAEGVTKEYSSQIWKQLNQYVKDYGDKKGYDLIVGGNGTGNVMHARESMNITKEVLEFVNEKYKGK